jgi:hypothetical protein
VTLFFQQLHPQAEEQVEIKIIDRMDHVFPVNQRVEMEVLAEELSEDLHHLAEQGILHQHHLHKVIQVDEDISHQAQ